MARPWLAQLYQPVTGSQSPGCSLQPLTDLAWEKSSPEASEQQICDKREETKKTIKQNILFSCIRCILGMSQQTCQCRCTNYFLSSKGCHGDRQHATYDWLITVMVYNESISRLMHCEVKVTGQVNQTEKTFMLVIICMNLVTIASKWS